MDAVHPSRSSVRVLLAVAGVLALILTAPSLVRPRSASAQAPYYTCANGQVVYPSSGLQCPPAAPSGQQICPYTGQPYYPNLGQLCQPGASGGSEICPYTGQSYYPAAGGTCLPTNTNSQMTCPFNGQSL